MKYKFYRPVELAYFILYITLGDCYELETRNRFLIKLPRCRPTTAQNSLFMTHKFLTLFLHQEIYPSKNSRLLETFLTGNSFYS